MKIGFRNYIIALVLLFGLLDPSAAEERVVIDYGATLIINNKTTFSNLSAGSGGAIYNEGTLVTNAVVNFLNNTANDAEYAYGGAIENYYGTVELKGAIFGENSAIYGGAIDSYGGTLTIAGSEFNSNTSTKQGGAIQSESGSLTVSDSKFSSNSSDTYGGAINSYNASFSLDNVTFSENTSKITGGAINYEAVNNTETSVIKNSIFEYNNSEDTGGAIRILGGLLDISDTYFEGNSAYQGGAIASMLYNDFDTVVNIVNSTFIENTAATAGAIANFRTMNVSNSKFTGNSATSTIDDEGGGAIFLGSNSTTAISNSIFTSNTAQESGGAISTRSGAHDNSGAILDILNSTFKENIAAEYGGAVYNTFYNSSSNSGYVTVSNSTFTGNSAKSGGAVYNSDTDKAGNYAAIYVDSSTFTGNIASSKGGAIYNAATAVIANSSFASNNANAYGGAVYNDEGTVTITNSVFESNKAKSMHGGAIFNDNGSLSIDGSTFNSNTATLAGGAISNWESGAVLVISNTTFTSNSTSFGGGALYNADGITTIANSNFNSNTSSYTGGAIQNEDGIVIIADTNFASNTAAYYGGAITNTGSASVDISNAIFTSNEAGESGGAIYNAATAVIANSSFVNNTAGAYGGAIYTLNDVIINSTDGYRTIFSGNSAPQGSAIYAGNSNVKISFNMTQSSSVLLEDEINGQTGYDVDIKGGSTSTTFYLYNDIINADVSIGNTTLNTLNNQIYAYNFNSFTLTDSINMAVDVDLAAETMDRITASSYGNHSGILNVTLMNLLSDTSKNSVAVYFAEQGLKNNVASGVSSIYTPIYKYNVSYDNRDNGGYFVFSKDGMNPSVMAGAVAAQVGGYLTQLNSFDEAFRNMDMFMLLTRREREALKFRNKFASANSWGIAYDPGSGYQDKQGWLRPYATFEKVGLKGGTDVSNVAYGSFFGADSGLTELGHGWDGVLGVYGGYNGSHQSYDGIGIYQNGGTLGVIGMAYKGNFYTGLTANAGANAGRASTYYGNEDFTLLTAGIASKTGYNFEFADGKFIVQPQYLMSYSFVNMFDYTNASGIKIKSDPLNSIQIAPGVKFIGNFENGWQPYAGVSMIWNIIDKTKFKAADVSLPELSVKPYVKYGIGVQKRWGDRFTAYLQAYITNGGRNGVGLQGGFSWALGKRYVYHSKTSAKLPELPAAHVLIKNVK